MLPNKFEFEDSPMNVKIGDTPCGLLNIGNSKNYFVLIEGKH